MISRAAAIDHIASSFSCCSTHLISSTFSAWIKLMVQLYSEVFWLTEALMSNEDVLLWDLENTALHFTVTWFWQKSLLSPKVTSQKLVLTMFLLLESAVMWLGGVPVHHWHFGPIPCSVLGRQQSETVFWEVVGGTSSSGSTDTCQIEKALEPQHS